MLQRILTNFYLVNILFFFKRVFFNGDFLRLTAHRYNGTWRNERAIEVSLAKKYLEKAQEKNILEIGNVLSHYFPVSHTIVDKYEKAPGVLNQDVAQLNFAKKFDLIISISTLEHVGWDEPIQNSLKVIQALRVLKKQLKPGGKIVVTFPFGYNPHMELFLKAGFFKFDETYFFKRTSYFNFWKQVRYSKVRNAKYGFPYTNANAICLGIIHA